MANIRIRGPRPVALQTQPFSQFEKQFRVLQSGDKAVIEKNRQANTHLIANVNVPLFNGQTFPGENGDVGRGRTDSTMVVNFGKMANISQDVQALLKTTAPGSEYTGNTGADFTVDGKDPTPVALDVVRDLSVQGKDQYRVTTIIDMQALANANDVERDAFRKANSLPALGEAAKGRLTLTAGLSTTDHGMPAMNGDRFRANVAQLASQNYLLTAQKKDPSRGVVSQDTINKVADTFSKGYADFVSKYADKACAGIDRQVKGDDGKYKTDKTHPVPNTAFPSLADMGISVVGMKDGSTALVVTDTAKNAANREGMNNFNNAFNAYMSQKVNQAFENDDAAKKLGNRFSIRSYPVTPVDPTKDGRDLTLIQPSTVMTMEPYAGAVTRAYECATHNEPHRQNETAIQAIEGLYGKEVLENAAKIAGTPAPVDKQAAIDQSKAVYAEMHDKADAMVVSKDADYGLDGMDA